MQTDKNRVNRLIEYAMGLKNREDGRGLYLKYQDDIAQVTPQEAFEVFSSLLEKGVEASEILVFLD